MEKKKEFPKVHHLEFILNLCIAIDQSFVNIKDDAVMLSEFYVINRYPDDYPEFTWQDAEKAHQAALRIKNIVLTNLGK
ncbi:HEPN domain-containing protein [Candidatus Wolfebacteria bacterium]|nr:HEPN domain-containing protein [Candidatus Wolfebacteria bacterium]